MPISLKNMRDLLLPALWVQLGSANNDVNVFNVGKAAIVVEPLDPAFSLDELEAAQQTIDDLSSK